MLGYYKTVTSESVWILNIQKFTFRSFKCFTLTSTLINEAFDLVTNVHTTVKTNLTVKLATNIALPNMYI